MIGAGKADRRDDFTRELAEAPLHPVADDGVPDLLADGESDPHDRVVVTPVADEKHESGSRGPPSGVGREEIRTFF